MAVANFFDKTAFGISQLFNKFDNSSFLEILSSCTVQIRFSAESSTRSESRITLDLLIRLLARLYPNLQVKLSSEEQHPLVNDLISLAKEINPDINTDPGTIPTVIINVGSTEKAVIGCPEYFVGSNRWLAYFSSSEPQSSNDSNNPFGAGCSACLAAANIFRTVFKKYLTYSLPDENLVISVFDYSINGQATQGPPIPAIKFDNTHLVGLGAIGNGVIWALQYLDLTGSFSLIDSETIELSNLQRYILTTQKDLQKFKTNVAHSFIKQRDLQLNTFNTSWEQYLQLEKNWNISIVGVAVDSANARIAIQASLPWKIINAWTQIEQIGISRHFDFIKDACLACLYLPSEQNKSLSEQISENLNLPHREREVRTYLADKLPIDNKFIKLIASHNKIDEEELLPFIGKTVEVFHSEVVCGGIFMRLTGSIAKDESIHVPSAFESALAGICLASELTISAGSLRTAPILNVTKMNMIRPITEYTKANEFAAKDFSDRCICRDKTYLQVYKSKWNL